MSPKDTKSENRRIRPRVPLALRVDVKILPKKEVDGILDGEGYPDLSIAALSMKRPRAGMEGTQTLDLSYSGMGLRVQKSYEKGTAAALDLHLPGDRTVVKFLGEVMWSVQDAGESRVGIRIAALDEDSARRFSGYLASA
jgi:hypothetical protein